MPAGWPMRTSSGGFSLFRTWLTKVPLILAATPVQTVAVCGYLEPLSAVIFSALLLHERLTPPQLIGACLIIGGALFAECVHPRRKAKKAVVQ